MSVLEIDNASKQFGNLVAVSGVSMSVASGELRAIIGPNGAGKTTFFNLITGFFPPTAGTILLDGRDITGFPAACARQAGHGPHLPDHRDLSGAHACARTSASPRKWPAASACGPGSPLGGRRSCPRRGHPQRLVSLEAKSDRLVGELAHGDQRAAEIAMALALKPHLLLLDEPTAGMGDEETYQITQLIRRCTATATTPSS